MNYNLDELFTYHPPIGDQPKRYDKIRKAGKFLAGVIVECTPECADQAEAIRKVREAVMTANAAIAIRDKAGYMGLHSRDTGMITSESGM